MKMAKTSHFHFLLDTPSPRRTRGLNFRLSDPPRQTSSPGRTSSPRHTSKSCFVFSFLLILAIIHWINEDPNK